MTEPQITHYTITSEKIPIEFDGFKIAHISDMHSRPQSGIAELISGENPDIIVITGDMLHDDYKTAYPELNRLLSDILDTAPVYAVTGNHDLWRHGHAKILSGFSEQGLIILDDDSVKLSRNGAEIALFGIKDPFSKLPSTIKSNLETSFSKLSGYDGYKILLFHRANLFDEIKHRGFDLILAGHMHGGQIRIPKMGGLLAPSSAILSGKSMIFPKYTAGCYKSDSCTMIVNRGSSNTLPIPRLFNPAEVGIITLVPKIQTN